MKTLTIADLFCGAGGTSTGAVQAAESLGYRVDLTAVNHWERAVETHSANHPEARHYCASVDSLNPRLIFPDGDLDVCWDKLQPWENFSQWEMAWTSFNGPAAIFRASNGGSYNPKIHPTQKPVKLYSWLLSKFAKPGQRILDTHLGSGSSAIACSEFGAHLTGCEIDLGYFESACARIRRETAQTTFPLSHA